MEPHLDRVLENREMARMTRKARPHAGVGGGAALTAPPELRER